MTIKLSLIEESTFDLTNLNSEEINNPFIGNYEIARNNLVIYENFIFLLKESQMFKVNIKCVNGYYNGNNNLVLVDKYNKVVSYIVDIKNKELKEGVLNETTFLNELKEYDRDILNLIELDKGEEVKKFHINGKIILITKSEIYVDDVFVCKHSFKLDRIIYTYFDEVIILGSRESAEFIYIFSSKRIFLEEEEELSLRYNYETMESIFPKNIQFYNGKIYLQDEEDAVTTFKVMLNSEMLESKSYEKEDIKILSIGNKSINRTIDNLLEEYSTDGKEKEHSDIELPISTKFSNIFSKSDFPSSLSAISGSKSDLSSSPSAISDSKSTLLKVPNISKLSEETKSSSISESFKSLEFPLFSSKHPSEIISKKTIPPTFNFSTKLDESNIKNIEQEKVLPEKFKHLKNYSKLNNSEKVKIGKFYDLLDSKMEELSNDKGVTSSIDRNLLEDPEIIYLERPKFNIPDLYTALLTNPLDDYYNSVCFMIESYKSLTNLNEQNVIDSIEYFDKIINTRGKVVNTVFNRPIQVELKKPKINRILEDLIEGIHTLNLQVDTSKINYKESEMIKLEPNKPSVESTTIPKVTTDGKNINLDKTINTSNTDNKPSLPFGIKESPKEVIKDNDNTNPDFQVNNTSLTGNTNSSSPSSSLFNTLPFNATQFNQKFHNNNSPFTFNNNQQGNFSNNQQGNFNNSNGDKQKDNNTEATGNNQFSRFLQNRKL